MLKPKPVVLDGRTLPSESTAAKRLGVERSTVTRALNTGRNYVKDAAGGSHWLVLVDGSPSVCPCGGKRR